MRGAALILTPCDHLRQKLNVGSTSKKVNEVSTANFPAKRSRTKLANIVTQVLAVTRKQSKVKFTFQTFFYFIFDFFTRTILIKLWLFIVALRSRHKCQQISRDVAGDCFDLLFSAEKSLDSVAGTPEWAVHKGCCSRTSWTETVLPSVFSHGLYQRVLLLFQLTVLFFGLGGHSLLNKIISL